MTGRINRVKLPFILLLVFLLELAGVSAVTPVSYAAVPKLDTIRVALFLESGYFKANTPSVTLSSPQGLELGIRTDNGVSNWISAAANKTVRASLDQYSVLLLDTGDFAKAKALKEQLEAGGKTAAIFSVVRSAKPFFQVYAGTYPDLASAQSALAALSVLPGVSAAGGKPSLSGPLHLNAGTYASEGEAAAQQAGLSQAGIDSELAITGTAPGKPAYSVWIGHAADAGQLSSVKQTALQASPGLQLTDIDADAPYLLRRNDVTGSSTGTGPIFHYQINPKGQKLWVSPSDQGKITVAEKSGRSYRGSLEFSSFNGKPALINELPFEQYLYSVVTNEMGKGWPQEALKAQAVSARTYALRAGIKYQIAHVSDSTLDQAYSGAEADDAVKAVDATKGEVLVNEDGLIDAVFSANAGGMSSSGEEAWGKALPYLKSVPSPDEGAAKGKAVWRRVALSDGKTGYIQSSYLREAGKTNPVGLPVYAGTEDGINVRTAPYVDNVKNPPIAKVNKGEQVVAFDEAEESNAFEWQRGPFSPAELAGKMNAVTSDSVKETLYSLEVTKRGSSGRVLEIAANGKPVKVSTPDAYRSLFGGLPSTLFEIEESGRYTILGAGGQTGDLTGKSASYYAYGGNSAKPQSLDKSAVFILNGDGKIRSVSQEQTYTFRGKGTGHGAGMSQWGARGLATLGYDYKYILQYYYEGVTLTKDGI